VTVETFDGNKVAAKKPFGITAVAFQEKANDNILQEDSHINELLFLDK